jgi:2-dehydropantoate 2-reductase
MTAPLRVGIVGAGSIGCYLGGRLIAAGAADVVMVGRPRVAAEVLAHGITLRELGSERVVPPAQIAFATALDAIADRDAILCCVKSGHTAEVGAALARVIGPDVVVASLQNGVRNAEVLRAALPGRRVLPGIVGFNVLSRGGGVFVRGTTGSVMLEASDEPVPRAVVDALAAAGIDVETRADLARDQWTKLLVNLNNAVSALTDAPTRDIVLSPALRRIVAAVIDEARDVLRAAKIKPAPLRGMPIGVVVAGLRMPTVMVRLLARAQLKVDPEARSSMWEDLQRGRPTEVDHLNGEIVRLAERTGNGAAAPLNARIVELVHAAERAGAGSPRLTADALWSALTAAR